MKRGMVAAAILMISSMSASADMLTFSMQYDTTFADEASIDTTGAGIGDKSDILFGGAGGNNPDWVHRISFYFRVDGLAAGEDFGGLAMNIELSGGITATPGVTPSWVSHNSLVVLPRPGLPNLTIAGGRYSRNSDAGPNGNDLKAILVETTAPMEWGLENAYLNPGSSIDGVPITSPAGPEFCVQKLGYVFVKWDGSYGEIGVRGCLEDMAGSHDWVKFTGNENGFSSHLEPVLSVDSTGQTLEVTTGARLAIPEPVTLSLLACGGLMLLGRRRAR